VKEIACHAPPILSTARQGDGFPPTPGGAWKEIQSICNGKNVPITMQRLAQARKNAWCREQWGTMEKTMDNNEKNNDEEQWEEEKIRGVPTSGCEPTGNDRA
jgi:hypothetical protein